GLMDVIDGIEHAHADAPPGVGLAQLSEPAVVGALSRGLELPFAARLAGSGGRAKRLQAERREWPRGVGKDHLSDNAVSFQVAQPSLGVGGEGKVAANGARRAILWHRLFGRFDELLV